GCGQWWYVGGEGGVDVEDAVAVFGVSAGCAFVGGGGGESVDDFFGREFGVFAADERHCSRDDRRRPRRSGGRTVAPIEPGADNVFARRGDDHRFTSGGDVSEVAIPVCGAHRHHALIHGGKTDQRITGTVAHTGDNDDIVANSLLDRIPQFR